MEATDIYEAVEEGMVEVLAEYEKKGNDLNSTDDVGDTLLHLAIRARETECVEFLLERAPKKVDVNRENDFGDTPLIAAADWGQTNVVRDLIAKGAKLDVRNAKGNTALYGACYYGHEGVVQALLVQGGEKAGVNQPNQTGDYPLHIAAFFGFVRIIRLLLEHGAHVDARNNDGSTPLHSACRYGHGDAIELLKEKGANINAQNNEGDTPMNHAILGNFDMIISDLISYGADVNLRNNTNETLLHDAARKGNPLILNILLEAGLDVNAINDNLETPMHISCRHNNKMAVEVLLAYGAEINIENKDGYLPVDIAASDNITEVITQFAKAKGMEIAGPKGDARESSIRAEKRKRAMATRAKKELSQLSAAQLHRVFINLNMANVGTMVEETSMNGGRLCALSEADISSNARLNVDEREALKRTIKIFKDAGVTDSLMVDSIMSVGTRPASLSRARANTLVKRVNATLQGDSQYHGFIVHRRIPGDTTHHTLRSLLQNRSVRTFVDYANESYPLELGLTAQALIDSYAVIILLNRQIFLYDDSIPVPLRRARRSLELAITEGKHLIPIYDNIVDRIENIQEYYRTAISNEPDFMRFLDTLFASEPIGMIGSGNMNEVVDIVIDRIERAAVGH